MILMMMACQADAHKRSNYTRKNSNNCQLEDQTSIREDYGQNIPLALAYSRLRKGTCMYREGMRWMMHVIYCRVRICVCYLHITVIIRDYGKLPTVWLLL